uniref:peptidylprolyl isomerase n=1 Tax=Eutreptiella gymnastica TaxID=73025 RepID=A0A7S1NKP3_9EUGL
MSDDDDDVPNLVPAAPTIDAKPESSKVKEKSETNSLDKVLVAIRALGEQDGSHPADIAKYLKSVNGDITGIRRALKRGVAKSLIKRGEGDKYSLVAKTGNKVAKNTVEQLAEGIVDVGGVQVTMIGKEPKSGFFAERGDTVTISYKGMLKEGMKMFDQNKVDFVLGAGDVIPGWERGVPGMREGEKRRLDIPHWLAYGKKGYKKTIPPKADLVFIVQLLKVRKSYEKFGSSKKFKK